MTVQHKIVVTRPSLDHLFFIEKFDTQSCIIYPSFGEHKPNLELGIIGSITGEQITWAEMFDRSDELRPDLRELAQSVDKTDYLNNIEKCGIGPIFNPFSLTLTIITEYTTLENALHVINDVFYTDENVRNTNLKFEETNNTVISEELFIDGVKDETFIGKFI